MSAELDTHASRQVNFTPLHFHKTLSNGGMRDLSRTSSASKPTLVFHGLSHQLAERQTPPEFGTLSTAFRSAFWMWTPDANGLEDAPVGNRFFRFTYTPPAGKVPKLGEVLIAVDDKYSLFVNGSLVGISPGIAKSWQNAQGYKVSLPSGRVVFAINAVNEGNAGVNPAGALVAIRITHTDGTEAIISSGDQWLTSTMLVPDFQLPSADDSQWTRAESLVRFGSGDWGTNVTLPATLTAVGIPGSSPSNVTPPTTPITVVTSGFPPSSSPIASLTFSSISTSSTSSTSVPFPTSLSHPPSTPITPTETTSNQAINAPSALSSSTSSTNPNKATLIGSILGGVVGGFLILLVTLLVVLRRRKLKAYLGTLIPAPLTTKNEATSSARSDSFPLAGQQQYSTNVDTQYGGQPQPPLPLIQPPPYQETYDAREGLRVNRGGQSSKR